MRQFGQGEQFTIFYGMRANCDLMVHNGFVFPDNQHDCLTIRLGVARTDSQAQARNALLERLAVNNRSFHLTRTENPLDGQLMAFLRVLQMDQAAIQEQMDKEDKEILSLCQVEVGRATSVSDPRLKTPCCRRRPPLMRR